MITASESSLTESQRKSLQIFLHTALKEIRVLAWTGKSDQAGDLADAIAPIPLMMTDEKFNWEGVYSSIFVYQQKYDDPSNGDYAKLLVIISNS